MRLWITVVVLMAPLVLATLFPRSAFVLLVTAVALVVGFLAPTRREMALLAPLVIADPLLVRIFPFAFPGRFLLLFFFGSTIWWYAVDFWRRRKGSPLALARMHFYFLAGLFPLTAAAFGIITNSSLKLLALDQVAIKPILLLGAIALLAALGTLTLRDAAHRAKALHTTTPAMVDALLVALFLAETFVGLSFLPLSPFTMAAGATVFCWGVLRVLLSYRTGALTKREIIRTSLFVTIFFAVILGSVPWISLS